MISFHFLLCYSQTMPLTFKFFPFVYFKMSKQNYFIPFEYFLFSIPFHYLICSISFHSLVVWASFALCSNYIGGGQTQYYPHSSKWKIQERARPNIQCEGKRISEDSQQKNGQNYPPRRGGVCL